MFNQFPASLLASLERSSLSGWLLLVIVLVALVKVWPIINLQLINAHAALRGERRDEVAILKGEVSELRTKLSGLYNQVHQLDLKLVGSVAAYRILHDHLSEHQPDNSALVQARTVFQTTWDGPIPSTHGLS